MILAARGLAIGYRGKPIGTGLDLEVTAGRTLALLGPNGGGKTTLLKTLIGLMPPLGGEISLDGRPLRTISIRERARLIAYVPQSHAGTFGFTVADVVLMGRTAHAGAFTRPARTDIAVASAAIERLGLGHLAERPYTMISGGERQLVLVARALAQEPRIVVLDEPTANLDFGNQGRVLREMRALSASGLAILFTTHDPNQAMRAAHDVVTLAGGGILHRGETASVITRPALETLYGVPVDEIVSGDRRVFAPQ